MFDLKKLLPAPDGLYSFASSIFVAAAIGGGYGLIGRIVYPKTALSPLNFAIWFALAYQIKECITAVEGRFDHFIGVGTYLDVLEHIPENELDLKDQIRYHCWKIIQLKTKTLKAIDRVFCKIFNIRPHQEIKAYNVEDASFLEMCRYRVWKVFKATVINSVSFALAYRLTNRMGFTLPQHTAVPLLIVIQSIVKDILLVPALYIYARICNHLANKLGDGDQLAAYYRVVWIRRFLPTL